MKRLFIVGVLFVSVSLFSQEYSCFDKEAKSEYGKYKNCGTADFKKMMEAGDAAILAKIVETKAQKEGKPPLSYISSISDVNGCRTLHILAYSTRNKKIITTEPAKEKENIPALKKIFSWGKRGMDLVNRQ